MSNNKCVLCHDRDFLVPHDIEDDYADWLAVTDAARKHLSECGRSLADDPQAELLTDREHQTVEKLGEVAVLLRDIMGGADDDVAEWVDKIHQLQHMVLSQAAARAYPDRYRLFGAAEGGTDT